MENFTPVPENPCPRVAALYEDVRDCLAHGQSRQRVLRLFQQFRAAFTQANGSAYPEMLVMAEGLTEAMRDLD